MGWSIGYYCNAKCKHCYSKPSRQNNLFLTKNEIDTVIDKLAKFNIETLNLGGNEPIFTNGKNITKTMLPYIIKKITDIGIKIGITTNGITASYLYKHHRNIFRLVNDWDVSFDSPFKNEHDKNRSIKIYDLAIKTLEIFTKENIPKAIVYCLMNWNCDLPHLSALLKLAKRRKAEIRINSLRPVLSEHIHLFPTPLQFYESFNYLIKNTSSIIVSEPLIAALCGIKVKGCPCGTFSMRIISKTKDGRVPVTPCVYLNSFAVGNILKEKIETICNSKLFKEIKNRNEKLPVFCREVNCEYSEVCRGGCAARAFLVSGDLNKPDPYCPKVLKQKGIDILDFPKIQVEKSGTRVHENYLCTWAGKPF